MENSKHATAFRFVHWHKVNNIATHSHRMRIAVMVFVTWYDAWNDIVYHITRSNSIEWLESLIPSPRTTTLTSTRAPLIVFHISIAFPRRYTIREQVLDDGMVSELGISHTFRHDTGVYVCQASNAYGQVTVALFPFIFPKQERSSQPIGQNNLRLFHSIPSPRSFYLSRFTFYLCLTCTFLLPSSTASPSWTGRQLNYSLSPPWRWPTQ